MTGLAAIFDAFGTLVKIHEGDHPYRKILKTGANQGRRPRPSDAENLLSLPLDLRQAADFFDIKIDSALMNQLESDLLNELANIQAYNDGLAAVEKLQDAGVKVIVCSNLAKPYASAIERLYPTLDGYAYSFALGAIKPSLEIYRHAVQLASVSVANAWMIGDSKNCDCDAPIAYGMRGFFLDRQGSGGHRTLHQFTEELLLAQRTISSRL